MKCMDIKITKKGDKYDVLLMTFNKGKECASISEIDEYIKEQSLSNNDKELNLYIDKNIQNSEYYKIINLYKK